MEHEFVNTIVNEDINDLTKGWRTTGERVAYEYSKIERVHQLRFLFDNLRVIKQTNFINRYISGENPFPESVEIDPANTCNHDCPYCIYHSLHHEGRMERLSEKRLMSLIHELQLLGCKSLLFVGGGEPMTHKSTLNAIELANDLGLSVGLVTNGSLVFPKVASRLKKAATYVRFSLDASCAETHVKMHRKDDFPQIIKNLEALASSEGKCTVGAGYFINEGNYMELFETANLVKSLGADYIQFKSYSGISIPESWYESMLLEVEKTFQLQSNRFDIHVMERIFHNSFYQARGYSKCHWQNFKTVIGANGDVFLCAQKRTSNDGIIGNINSTSMNEIWEGDNRKSVISNLVLKDCPFCVHHNQNQLIEFLNSFKEPHKSFI